MCYKKIFNYIVIIGILSFIVLATTLSSSINADDYVDPNIFGGGVSNSSSSSSSSSTFHSGNTSEDSLINFLLYGSSSSTSSSSSSGSISGGFCKTNPGSERYCADCGPCSEGQSMCFNDSQCNSGLVCNSNGVCVRSSNQSSGPSGCGIPPIPRERYCRVGGCGPCQEGEGWCEDDSECVSGLVCNHSYCVRPTNPSIGSDGCRLQEGTLTYCAVCGPCSEGQSVCHKDSECSSGLVCTNNGFCVRPSNQSGGFSNNNNNTCKVPVGSATYCKDCGPCREGQGKCSKDTDCIKGLVCSNHTGLCKKP